MIRLRPSGADEVLIKRVRDWYEPGPGVFIAPQALFNPALLFTTGVNGTWYDPSDLNTLFQDAAGTTPVTAVEQPVGLMLDKSKGLVLGPELVTNGDFSNGTTGWVTANGGAVVNSRCECTTASNFLSTTAAILTVGKWYSAEFDYFMTAGAKLRVATKDTVGPDAATIVATSQSLVTNAVTRLKIKFQAAVGGFFILQASDATFSGWVDNISVRELPGNHAFNSSGNSANFPVLSARYNLATETEFRNGLTDAPVRGGLITATTLIGYSGAIAFGHDGSTTSYAYKIQPLAGSMQYTLRIIVQMTDGNPPLFPSSTPGSSNNDFAFVVGSDTPNPSTATVSSLGSGVYLISIGYTTPSTPFGDSFGIVKYNTNSSRTFKVTAYDLRVSNDALNQPVYQRVNTSTDYDTVGFKPYLRFNGTNQWLQTNSIDFSYGDKMFVCAGVRKLVDQIGMVAELSPSYDGSNGSFGLTARSGAGNDIGWASRGTTLVPIVFPVLAPVTTVASGIGNISAPSATLRVNGAQVAQSTASQGTGSYGNYPLYIGSRNGNQLFFNGRLHQLVVAGKQASASEIGQTEAFTNQKTGAY